MVDLDKLIGFAIKVFKNRIGITPLFIVDFLESALKEQGLKCDECGNIFKELGNYKMLPLKKGNTYICISDVWQPEGDGIDFVKGKEYECPADGFLFSEGGHVIKPYVFYTGDYFKLK